MRAHQTNEHLPPLFVALGAGRDYAKAERVYDSIDSDVLAIAVHLFR